MKHGVYEAIADRALECAYMHFVYSGNASRTACCHLDGYRRHVLRESRFNGCARNINYRELRGVIMGFDNSWKGLFKIRVPGDGPIVAVDCVTQKKSGFNNKISVNFPAQ